MLECVAKPSSRASSQLRESNLSLLWFLHCRQILYLGDTGEAQEDGDPVVKESWRLKWPKHRKTHQSRRLISPKERETLLGYKHVSCILEDPYYKILASFIDTERRAGSPKAGGRGDAQLVFNGHKVSAREDEKVLETDGGDGYTTM